MRHQCMVCHTWIKSMSTCKNCGKLLCDIHMRAHVCTYRFDIASIPLGSPTKCGIIYRPECIPEQKNTRIPIVERPPTQYTHAGNQNFGLFPPQEKIVGYVTELYYHRLDKYEITISGQNHKIILRAKIEINNHRLNLLLQPFVKNRQTEYWYLDPVGKGEIRNMWVSNKYDLHYFILTPTPAKPNIGTMNVPKFDTKTVLGDVKDDNGDIFDLYDT